MKRNEGSIDRILRVAIGLGALSLTVIGPQTPWGYIGVIPLATGLIGWCPLYQVFGLSTCPLNKSES